MSEQEPSQTQIKLTFAVALVILTFLVYFQTRAFEYDDLQYIGENPVTRRDRVREERVLEFFAKLPKEPENRIQRILYRKPSVYRVFFEIVPCR